MKIKPFERSGGHTVFDNRILDYIMPNCSPNCWKVICVTIRKTRGWQKQKDQISFSQYLELSGIATNKTLTKAIQEALDSGYILRHPIGQSFSYELNLEFEIEIAQKEDDDRGESSLTGIETIPVQKMNRYRNDTSSGIETIPELVSKGNTQNKKQKTNIKNISSNGDELKTENIEEKDLHSVSEKPKELSSQQNMIRVLSEVTGMSLKIKSNAGRLAARSKELLQAGFSPEQILIAYSASGGWWYKHDWRGEKGQPPTSEQIIETIGNINFNAEIKSNQAIFSPEGGFYI